MIIPSRRLACWLVLLTAALAAGGRAEAAEPGKPRPAGVGPARKAEPAAVPPRVPQKPAAVAPKAGSRAVPMAGRGGASARAVPMAGKAGGAAAVKKAPPAPPLPPAAVRRSTDPHIDLTPPPPLESKPARPARPVRPSVAPAPPAMSGAPPATVDITHPDFRMEEDRVVPRGLIPLPPPTVHARD